MDYESLVRSLVAALVTVEVLAVRRRVRPHGSAVRVLCGAVHDCLHRPQPQLLVVDETAQIRRRPR